MTQWGLEPIPMKDGSVVGPAEGPIMKALAELSAQVVALEAELKRLHRHLEPVLKKADLVWSLPEDEREPKSPVLLQLSSLIDHHRNLEKLVQLTIDQLDL